MPNIYEMGEPRNPKAGPLKDHDELEYLATENRAKTLDPRQRYVPSLCTEPTDALIDIASARHR